MPRENVEVNYSVTGTQQGAAQVDAFNKKVQETGNVAKTTDKATGDVGAGVSALGQAFSFVNPQVGQYIGLVESAKFASEGLAAGLSNLAAAGKSLIGFFANPFLIAGASIFLAIAQAVRENAAAQEKLNAEMAAYSKRVEESRREIESLHAAEQQRIQQDVGPVAGDLASAGIDPEKTKEAIDLIASAAEETGLAIEKVRKSFTDFIRETGRLPSQAELGFISGAGEVPGLAGLSVTEQLRQRPSAQQEVDRRNRLRSESIAGDAARQQAEAFRQTGESATAKGSEIRDLESQLQDAEERLLNLITDLNRERLNAFERLLSEIALTFSGDESVGSAERRSDEVLNTRIAQEQARVDAINQRIADARAGASGPVVSAANAPDVSRQGIPPSAYLQPGAAPQQGPVNDFLGGLNSTIINIYGNPSFNGSESPVNRGGNGQQDRFID